MSNIAVETSDHTSVPLWKLALTWPLVIVLLKCANAGFSSSQDIAAGAFITGSGALPHELAAKIFGYTTQVLLLAILAPHHRRIAAAFRENYLVTATVLLAFGSCAWSQDTVTTLRALYWLILSVSFILWMSTKLSLPRQMQLLMIAGAAAAFLSILAVVLVPSLGVDKFHDSWQGVFQSKNHMGRMFLFLLTPAIHYETNTGASRRARLVYIVLMLFLIGMTQSKSAWIFTILYLSLAVLLNLLGRVSRRDKYIAVGLTSIAISAASFLVITNLGEILLLFGRDATLSGRTSLWKVLLVSVAKRPWFGYGYQAFWAGPTSEAMNVSLGWYYLVNRFTGTYAHSGYLSVILDNGIVGLGLIVSLAVKSGRDAIVCIGWAQKPIINWYIGVVVLTLVYNIDEVTFMVPAYLPWMMFLLAVIGLSNEAHRTRSRRFA